MNAYMYVFRHGACLLNHFSCIKFNHLRWHNFLMTSMKMKFNILARSWKFKKIQRTWQNAKYKSMYQIEEVVMLIITHFVRCLWTHSIRSKPIIKTPFIFEFQIQRLHQGLSLSKKPWSMILKKLLHLRKNLSEARH